DGQNPCQKSTSHCDDKAAIPETSLSSVRGHGSRSVEEGAMMARYIVRSGDTFSAIASRFGMTLAALEAANPQIADPNRIFPGQVITIPARSPAPGPPYVGQPGEPLPAIPSRFGMTLAALEAANPQIADPNRIFPGQVITTSAVAVTYVRHDIWTLDQQNHWHPTIYAYARGISVMQQRAA